MCHETLCKTPQRIGYYAAGPALEGTYCGGKKVALNIAIILVQNQVPYSQPSASKLAGSYKLFFNLVMGGIVL